MALLANLPVLLVLACVSHQIAVSSCQEGDPGGKGRAIERVKLKTRGQKERPSKTIPPLLEKNQSRVKSPIKGKFVSKAQFHCTWVAAGSDYFAIGVSCRKEGELFSCEYVAKPDSCPQFASNAKVYWKQIERSLRKQKRLCRDATAPITAGLCRKAPRDSHFKLNNSPRGTVPSTPRPSVGESCKDSNHKLAEEYCGDTWSSFCRFFFAIVQNGDCSR